MTQESAPMPERDVSLLRRLYPVLPTTEAGMELAEEWMAGFSLLNDQRGSVPERILAVEQEAAAIERSKTVERIRATLPDWFPCRCIDAYKNRNLVDPDCPTHDMEQWLDELSPPSSDRGAE